VTPEGAWKLLGGYAAGTLTEQERNELLEAALHDQKLFDALADEEVLRQALDDDPFRRELAGMLNPRKPNLAERLAGWWIRPTPLAWAGSLAAMAIVAVLVYRAHDPEWVHQKAASSRLIVESSPPAPVAVPPAASRAPKRSFNTSTLQQERPQPIPSAKDYEAPPEVAPPDSPTLFALSEPARPAAPPLVILKDQPQELAAASQKKALAPTTESDIKRQESVQVVEPRTAFRTGPRPSAAGAFPSVTTAGQRRMFHYRLERRGPDGAYTDLLPSAPLSLEDNIRLTVDTSVKGHLYLVDKSNPEAPRLLFTGLTEPGQHYLIPLQGSLPPPARPGKRSLVLLYSPKPLSLDALGVTGSFNQRAAAYFQEIVLNYQQNP
jgi:hypothetical protein